jgi:hypothetical protein
LKHSEVRLAGTQRVRYECRNPPEQSGGIIRLPCDDSTLLPGTKADLMPGDRLQPGNSSELRIFKTNNYDC